MPKKKRSKTASKKSRRQKKSAPPMVRHAYDVPLDPMVERVLGDRRATLEDVITRCTEYESRFDHLFRMRKQLVKELAAFTAAGDKLLATMNGMGRTLGLNGGSH